MIMFADGREFQLTGTILTDGTTIIPFAAISLGTRPSSFPLPISNVASPVMFVELHIVGDGTFLTAMSLADYNVLAIAESQRNQPSVVQTPLLQRAAAVIARGCGSCGRR